ncbi:ABC transporter ATP-binding protein [Porphyromonas macacae]|uniref:Lipoprotein-releasing system ATP-binding protein LolD n=1 Tax=Porphyromonas macacae TaxID=28115 RepID=A0A379DHT8_9PORP|nr:Lipoprotein-releasing system ATP-binding protein LolD [Porphyromonas macacae]
MSKEIIAVRNIHKTFGTLEVLKGIDLTVSRGEIVSIVGASGAGKSTLLQIMGTLEQPDKGGEVIIDGRPVTQMSLSAQCQVRNKQIGFIFQAHRLLPEFTALENVMIPAFIAGIGRHKAGNMAKELLDMLKLGDRLYHKPAELSGGECQRVAVARALINQPAVVLADEPSGSLDTANKAELHNLFFELRDSLGQTFVIVTHDETLAAGTDRKVRMRDGLIEQNTLREGERPVF